jgi:CBS domain-containing protein
MNIGSICKRDAVTIDQAATLHDAAQMMREQHVGALVVTGEDADGMAGVLGVVTDRDLAVEVLARGRDGASVSVATLISGRMVAVPWDASLSDAVAAMESEGVRRLLVTGRLQELIGVISIDDVIEAWAADMSRLSRSLRKAREIEEQTVPSPLDALLLSVPDDALIPAWQRRT